MKPSPLVLISLLAIFPAAAQAQGMDVPTGANVPPSDAVVGGEPAAAKPVKNGPYFGFSFGTGTGNMTAGGTTDSFTDISINGEAPTTLALQLRSGWGTGDYLFGMQLNMMRTWWDISGVSSGMEFMGFDVVATWWDQDAGLYARVGIGPSQFSWFADDYSTESVSGVEMMFGVGATMGGMGVGIDFIRQAYEETEAGFSSVTYMLAMLSLDMY